MQSMSITAVSLCVVCCLLVIFPDPCSCKKFKRPIAVVLIILNLIAGKLNVLIIKLDDNLFVITLGHLVGIDYLNHYSTILALK